jgi:predicted alpha-1,2-mannosidase
MCIAYPVTLLAQTRQLADYVNPLVGSALKGDGGTDPFVNPPFAMTNFVAQTDQNAICREMPYVYEDSTIIGFLATHQPTVCMGDYGYVSVMPEIGHLKVLPKKRQLKFSHKNEKATPYYYSVLMRTPRGKRLKAEMAATEHCGILRFTFPQSNQAHIIVQGINLRKKQKGPYNSWVNRYNHLSGYVHINQAKDEITGYNPDRMSYNISPRLPNFKGYFVIKFSKPFKKFGTWDEDSIYASHTKLTAKRMGAYISFKTRKNEKIKVKIGTSFISIAQARENLHREIPQWNFKRVVQTTKVKWNHALHRIEIPGAPVKKKELFYSEMYHTLLFPRKFSEYGRYYSAFDDTVHKGISYNDYSLWDIYRAEEPLLIFTQPDRINGMVAALVQDYEQGGWMPKWPNPAYTNIMIGTHADSFIADAFIKGFRGYNVQKAYAAMRKDAFTPPRGDIHKAWGDRDPWTGYEARGGLTYYKKLGYVPVNKTNESVSRTLEFAYDDFCVAQVAKALRKTSDYKKLMARSKNYRNVYNDSTGFMAPRLSNRKWASDPNRGFTEGSKWNYLFAVQQDVPGLIKLMGGAKNFDAKLDSAFVDHRIRYDNEPANHYAYLYDYGGQPWKTQQKVRELVSDNFHDRPDGLTGNDDCGQMSAWYIFGVMGFYPVNPGSTFFAIGAPQLPKIVMHLGPKGKTHPFTIIAKNLSSKNKYIQKATLDGKPLKKPFITYQEIMNGKRLVFTMGSKPNYNWK